VSVPARFLVTLAGAVDAPRDPHALIGCRLGERYRVDRIASEGHLFLVYEGWDEQHDASVAVKVPTPHAGPELGAAIEVRLAEEVRIHDRLSAESDGVVRALAIGAVDDGEGAPLAWGAFAWLDGQPLAEELWVRRLRGAHGRSLDEALALLDPVIDALARAHEARLVHLDVGSHAVFLARGDDGRPHAVLTGFGASAWPPDFAALEAPDVESLARRAPEQIDPSLGRPGAATDVYALALVLVELMSDKPPIPGESAAEIERRVLDHRHRPTPLALGVPVSEAVEAMFARALAVDPLARPATAREFAAELASVRGERRDAPPSSAGGAPPALGALPLLRVPYGHVDIRSISALPPPPRAPADLAPSELAAAASERPRPASSLRWVALALAAAALAAAGWSLLR
jgi:serine/threonine-protein kinase